MYEITRKKLIKIAFKTIENYTESISDTNRRHLLYAACTAETIALGEWVVDNKCGCLVGTAYLQTQPESENLDWEPDTDYCEDKALTTNQDEAHALYLLGIEFDDNLRQALVDKYGDTNFESVIKVRD